jgi:hypothetical protein
MFITRDICYLELLLIGCKGCKGCKGWGKQGGDIAVGFAPIALICNLLFLFSRA